MKTTTGRAILLICCLMFLSFASRGQELFVGTNYHPHDNKDPEKIKKDIMLMKAAGFKVVRMGHLAWDSYEPAEGKFDFKWFDAVMEGIKRQSQATFLPEIPDRIS